jgi:hypothetical protein
MEEGIFYPAMRAAGSTMLDDLEPEHEEMRSLIATLSGMQPGDPQYDQTFMELGVRMLGAGALLAGLCIF